MQAAGISIFGVIRISWETHGLADVLALRRPSANARVEEVVRCSVFGPCMTGGQKLSCESLLAQDPDAFLRSSRFQPLGVLEGRVVVGPGEGDFGMAFNDAVLHCRRDRLIHVANLGKNEEALL